MEKSFGEILSDSFTVLKNIFPSVLKVFGIFVAGTALSVLTIVLTMGTEFLYNMNNEAYMQNYFSTMSLGIGATLVLAMLFLFVFSYICYCSVILLVRNNVLGIFQTFAETFAEAFRKFWRILLALFLVGIVCSFFVFLTFIIPFFLFPKDQVVFAIIIAFLLFFVAMLVLVPPCFAIFNGVLCRDENFFTVFGDSIKLGFRRWPKIVGYIFLITLITTFPSGIVLGIISGIAQILNAVILGTALSFIVQIIVNFFVSCCLTILYLDISGMSPRQTLPDNTIN